MCLLVTVALLVCQLLLCRKTVAPLQRHACRFRLCPLDRLRCQPKTQTPAASLFLYPYSYIPIPYSSPPHGGDIYQRREPVLAGDWRGIVPDLAGVCPRLDAGLSPPWLDFWRGFDASFGGIYSSAIAAILSDLIAGLSTPSGTWRLKAALTPLSSSGGLSVMPPISRPMLRPSSLMRSVCFCVISE